MTIMSTFPSANLNINISEPILLLDRMNLTFLISQITMYFQVPFLQLGRLFSYFGKSASPEAATSTDLFGGTELG